MKDTLNQTELRAAFWDAHPQFAQHFRKTKRQNEYNATIRCFWVDYVDNMERDGQISRRVAQNATL